MELLALAILALILFVLWRFEDALRRFSAAVERFRDLYFIPIGGG